MKDYELIEHTADIGIRVKAEDIKGLFISAAKAMFDIISQRIAEPEIKTSMALKLQGQDLAALFITWLNELLSLSSAKELIFSEFKIKNIDNNRLEATIYGESAGNYRMNCEIKAATYHQLKIEEARNGWVAEVIFDV